MDLLIWIGGWVAVVVTAVWSLIIIGACIEDYRGMGGEDDG